MNDSTIISIIAILAVVALEIVALMLGHNGILLTGALALIAGLAGYEAKNIQTKITTGG